MGVSKTPSHWVKTDRGTSGKVTTASVQRAIVSFPKSLMQKVYSFSTSLFFELHFVLVLVAALEHIEYAFFGGASVEFLNKRTPIFPCGSGSRVWIKSVFIIF